MLYHLLENVMSEEQLIYVTPMVFLSLLIAFVLCYVLLKAKLPFLPEDKGREFAVNGELSKGKNQRRRARYDERFCFVLGISYAAERRTFML